VPLLDPTPIKLHRIGIGSPVVLLHGIGETHEMWDCIAPLVDRFEMIAYDFPGHGNAAPPHGVCEIESLSDQLFALLTMAGIDRTHVVGSCLGGMVAQHFAATWPDRVDRLVLCDTTPALSEGMREEFLSEASHGPLHGAMARADLLDLAEEIFAPTLVLCAEGAAPEMREGAEFLARSIARGKLAYVIGAARNVVMEQPRWAMRVLRDFLG
jgi:pimeloyl-ACP methyl ester carboxylesterase